MNTCLCGAAKQAIHKKSAGNQTHEFEKFSIARVIDRLNYCLAIKINLALSIRS